MLMDLPSQEYRPSPLNLNDFALIDEISGLNNFLENVLRQNDVPETVRQRIKSRMHFYNSEVPKEIALNEIREVIFGGGR